MTSINGPMNVNKSLITLLVIFSCSKTILGQTSLNLYPLNGMVGIKFFTGQKISIEPRLDFQLDVVDGESNIFTNAEIFTTVNFMKEEDFYVYSGISLGANIYNQAQSNFSGSIPLGFTQSIGKNQRLAIVGECGVRFTVLDFIKAKSYALVGLQLRLFKSTS